MKHAIAALVLLLAACGSTAAPASAPPPSSGPGSTAGASGPLEDLKAQAQKEGGKVLWYDSVEQDQGDKIIEQFKADYPFMSGAKFVSVVSGQRVARITQESSAKGPTADVDFGNAQTITDFKNKGFVESVDWQSLGIKTSPQLAPNDYLLAVTAPFYVIAYNSNKVKADYFAKKLASQQNVRLYDSNFTIAQDIGAGNIDVALTFFFNDTATTE